MRLSYNELAKAWWRLAGAGTLLSLCLACATPAASSEDDREASAHAPHDGSDPDSFDPPVPRSFSADFRESAPLQAEGGSGGAPLGLGGADATGGRSTLQAPFGTSNSCGDAIVGGDEECDDGDNGDDACTQYCRTRDQSSLAVGAGTDRYLGAGRHPIAGLDSGFITAFTEAPSYPDSDDDAVEVGATLFDIWGRLQHHVTVSDGALPIDEANPVAAALPGGNYVVAWSDFDGDGSGLGIALRRVKSDGAVGPLATANAGHEFSQRNPDMIWTGSQLVVAWEDYANPETGPDIRYRLFDANLNALSGDQTLAEGGRPEGAVSLAPFAGGWAAAYREEAGGQFASAGKENVVVRVGTKTFRIGAFPGGPMTDRPALSELDSTHLLVVVSVGTDPAMSGVYNVPRLRYAVVDTESTTTPVLQALDPMDDLYTSDALVSHSSPALAHAEDGSYLAWRSEARPGDADGDQVWMKRVSWNPMATPPRLDVGEPELLIPRDCEGSVGHQQAPALAPVPLPPHGALAFAWDDYGHTQGAGTGDPDVAIHYAPVHPRGSTSPKFLRETWTAPLGAAWSARWSTQTQPVPTTVPMTVDIRYNAGRLATITNTSAKALAWINNENALNLETKVKVRFNSNLVSGSLIARRADEDPDSYFGVAIGTLNQPLKIYAVIDGVTTTIASQPLPYLFNGYIQGLDLFLKFRVITNADASITLSANVWLADSPEPQAWMLVGTVPASGTSVIRQTLGARPGRFGLSAELGSTNRSATFDDFQAVYFSGAGTNGLDSDQPAPPPFPRDTSQDSCCETDDECGELACSSSISMLGSLGLGSSQSACVPSHCTNKQMEPALGETDVDCGGTDCGPCTCARTGLPAAPQYCSVTCPCGVGLGDCGSSDVCLPGLVCRQVGWRYGPTSGDDVCIPFHCNNRIQDADELGPDWGGSCGSLRCDPNNQLGDQGHCTVACPCGRRGGDCDANDECEPGMICSGRGPTFGVLYNVCVALHCANNVKDADEIGIDCGGADCGPTCP